MNNWLEIAVGVFLLGMVLYGHWRGLVRLGVSMLSLVITLLVVRFAMPYASAFLRENTAVHGWLAERVEAAFQVGDFDDEEEEGGGDVLEPSPEAPSAQRRFIEAMDLPDGVKDLLIENNNSQVYDLLGVDAFAGYVGKYLAGLVLNLIGFLVMFAAVYIGLRLLANALDLVTKLPILSGLNQLAGAVLGGIQGLIYLWIFFLILSAFSKTGWAGLLLERVDDSVWLSFLYRYNLVSRLILGIVRAMFV